MDKNLPKGKKLPKPSLDDGAQLAKIAAKQSKLSKDELRKQKAETDASKGGEKKQKAIPTPNAKKWMDKIRRSEKVRKEFVQDADRYQRMYQGDYSLKPSKRRNVDGMSVNIVYAYVEMVVPSVFSGFPYIKVRPKPKSGQDTASVHEQAKNMELVINYWFKELAVDVELRDIIFDSFFGLAGAELGWETEVIEEEPIITGEEGEEKPGKKVITIKDRPFIDRRDFRNIVLDPDAKRLRDCRWIATEEVLHFNDFLSSSLYTEKAKSKVKAQMYPRDTEDKNWLGRDEDNGDKEWIQIYTIWDKDNRKKYCVTKEYMGYLNTDDEEGEDWPYDIDHNSDPYPFEFLEAKRDRMTPYSWSEFKAIEPQIQEVNRIRNAQYIHVKRTLPKYIYTDQVGTKADVAKLMNARSDEAVKLENLDSIRPLQNAEIPQDLWRFAQTARDDLTNISGIMEYQQESLANTATEASIVQGNLDVRKSMKSRMLEQFVVRMAAKLAQLCQQNMDEKVAIEIAGPKGIEWLEVNKDQIQGEFWYDIEPGNMQYKNQALRQQQLLKFLELTQNDPNANRRYLISQMADELDLSPEDAIVPPEGLPKPPPPPPLIKFKEIDILGINDSGLMNMLVAAAAQQNGLKLTPEMLKAMGALPPMPPSQGGGGGNGGPMPPPGGGGMPPSVGGKDIADTGLNPNGNPSMPPVVGNANLGGNGK